MRRSGRPDLIGGGHCCVCSVVCGHIGGPFFCSRHDPAQRRMGGAGDLNLPFEPQKVSPLPDTEGDIAGGLIVMAAMVDVPEAGPMPALVFRFSKPDGSGFFPPSVLVSEDQDLAALPALVTAAVEKALSTAKAAR